MVKSLLKWDVLQVFKNKEESQEDKDDMEFTKCLAAVTKHIIPRKSTRRRKSTFGTSVNP
eukprot:12140290-Ditylum_brightwellii.AAC.1